MSYPTNNKSNPFMTAFWIAVILFCLYSLLDIYNKAHQPKPFKIQMDVIADFMLLCNDRGGLKSIVTPVQVVVKDVSITAVCKNGLEVYRVVPASE